MKLSQTLEDGAISATLSFELHRAASAPSLASATGDDEYPPLSESLAAQTLSQSATASMPQLLQVFEQFQLAVAISQATLMVERVDELRDKSDTKEGEAQLIKEPPKLPPVILTAPQGYGKSKLLDAVKFSRDFKQIFDEWSPGQALFCDAIHVTNVHPNDLLHLDAVIIERGWQ